MTFRCTHFWQRGLLKITALPEINPFRNCSCKIFDSTQTKYNHVVNNCSLSQRRSGCFPLKGWEKDSAMTCFSFGSAARVYPQECRTRTGRCTAVRRSWASRIPPCTPLPVLHTGPVCPVRQLTEGTCLAVQKQKHTAPQETHTDQHSQDSGGGAQTGSTH